MTITELLLVAAALLAGFIDAIAGGGGLVLLPALSLILGAGPTAIGTNKPASLAMAAIALIANAGWSNDCACADGLVAEMLTPA